MRYFSLLLCFCFVSCATFKPRKDPTRFYQLNAMASENVEISSSTRWVLLPVVVPDFLTRENYLSKMTDNQVRVYPFDRWIEPLPKGVERVSLANLQLQLGMVFEKERIPVSGMNNLELLVDKFICDEERAYVSVFATKMLPDGKKETKYFLHQLPLSGSEVSSQVMTLQEALYVVIEQVGDWLSAQ